MAKPTGLGLLPPSPNWYCSRACDTSQDGVFAFATKNTVFLLNTKTNPPSSDGSLHGHSERITGVSFCTAADQSQQCVTSSDDCFVKVWDVKTKAVLKEHKVHQFKLTTVHWSPLSKDLIVSGDEKGALVCWDLGNNDSKLYIPEPAYIYSLACSPHNVSHVAVGYKTSLVLLIDIKNKGTILHRLRGHDDEIHSIIWSPSLGENLQSKQPSANGSDDSNWRDNTHENSDSPAGDGCILLTGSKDRTIRVWGTSSGKLIQTLRLPPKGVQRTRDRGDDGGRGGRVWVALYWVPNEDRIFICSSHSGDIVRCDLSRGGKPKWEHLGALEGASVNMHLRIVFSIVPGPSPETFISTSMDRKIICWNASTMQADWCLPSLGGFVYRIAASPLDQSRLAIGVGDNMIRVWNTAATSKNCDVTVLWQGIKSKVTTVSWHPTRENCLAFGTDEGRVGIYLNLNQSNKPPLLANTYHRKTVYALSWGPTCPAKPEGSSSYHLYSCGGEGAVLQHDPSNMQGNAVNVTQLIQATNNIQNMLPQRTDVSWRRDGRAVAMGNDDGSIDVFAAPNLLLLCTIHVHHKLINCLQWYPLSDHPISQLQAGKDTVDQSDASTGDAGINDGQSEQLYWLASASNDPHVNVYDLGSVLGPKEPVQLDSPITNSMCCLSGHTLRVTALSWSPHGDARLVSASYDGSAQVWDAAKGVPLANYRGHAGRIFTCYWSSVDENAIYTGSEDFTLRKWKVSECEHKYPPKKKKEALKTIRYQPGEGDGKYRKNKKQKPKRDTRRNKSPEPTNKEADNSPRNQMVKSIYTGTDQSDHKDIKVDQSISVPEGGAAQGVKQEVKIVNEIGDAETNYLEEAAEGVKEPSYLKIRKDKGKKKKQKSLFPLCSSLDNRSRTHRQTDCVLLAKTKYDGSQSVSKPKETENEETTHLKFFSDTSAMYDVFKDEANNHTESGYFDQKHTLGLWKGNIVGELEDAKQQGVLSDMMVAMSAIGGPDVWLEVCEAYAEQLEKREDFVKAASYYIACHQITKAIQLLMNNRYHREAAAMAAVRLPSNDPLLIEVYVSWAVQLEREGSFEQAAKCYLAVDQTSDAIRLLYKKGDTSSLKASLEVAIFAKQDTMATTLMARYVNECMLTFDWSGVQESMSDHVLLQAAQLVLQVHETMIGCWTIDHVISPPWYEEPVWSPWQPVITGADKQVYDTMSSWPIRIVDDSPLLSATIASWAGVHKIDITDKDKVAAIYQCLMKSKPQEAGQNVAMKQLMIYLANEVVLGQLSIYMGNIYQAAAHWLQALITCHNIGEYDVAKGLVKLILSKGNASIEELRQKLPQDESQESNSLDHKKTVMVLKCLEAYYSLTLLYHLWWEFGSLQHGHHLVSQNTKTECSNAVTGSTADVMLAVSEQDSSGDFQTNASTESSQHTSTLEVNGEKKKLDYTQKCCKTKASEFEALFERLQYISDVLLSESHTKYSTLKDKLNKIQISVSTLVSKHRPDGNQRVPAVNSVADNDVLEKVVAGMEVDANTAGSSVNTQGLPKGSDNKTDIVKNHQDCDFPKTRTDMDNIDQIPHANGATSLNCISESGPKEESLPEEILPYSLIELTTAHTAVVKEIDLIPAEIKDLSFPDPISSARILVYFCWKSSRLCEDEVSARQLRELHHRVTEWGHKQCHTEMDRGRFAKQLLK